MPAPTANELEFRAMGTDVHVVVVGGAGDSVGWAVERIEELEQRWSRFRETSEISRLNRSAGVEMVVSDDTALLIQLAIEAFHLSGGSFDPTVLGAVVRAGYDRSFDQLSEPSSHRADANEVYRRLVVGCNDIEQEGNRVRLPAGTGFDPGGIGKGLAADLVSDALIDRGAIGACVNMGGDVRVRGVGPDGGGWTIAIDQFGVDEPLAIVGLDDGAVATSTTLRRTWDVDGERRHHLIDPGTGLPSDSDLVHVSVIAENAWVAEILAKAVLLRGSEHPFDLIGGSGAEALAVDRDGRRMQSDGFARFTI
jgi:thiamine biosynthesis lipoprotein